MAPNKANMSPSISLVDGATAECEIITLVETEESDRETKTTPAKLTPFDLI